MNVKGEYAQREALHNIRGIMVKGLYIVCVCVCWNVHDLYSYEISLKASQTS
jgi:hypothetical protein